MRVEGPSMQALIAILILAAIGFVAVKWSSNRYEPSMCSRALSDPARASRETLEDCADAPRRPSD